MIKMLKEIDQLGRISQTDFEIQSSTETRPEMKTINIVVNPSFINDLAIFGNEEARQVLLFIAGKKRDNPDSTSEYREVFISGGLASQLINLVERLDIHLPDPSPDLQLYVCGANTDFANVILLFELRKKGYRAKFNHQASCAGLTEPPQMMLRQILDMFPDFLD
jgi:hypothetical protein